MSRVERKAQRPVPPITRLGLLVPGLGHLADGEVAAGIALLAQSALLAAALILGLPRLSQVLWPEGRWLVHPLLAVAGWVGIAGCVARLAWIKAFPAAPVPGPTTWTALVTRAFLAHRAGMIGLGGVCALATLTLLTPLIAPFDPLALFVGPALARPSLAFPLGTDEFGRDVLSRLLYGGRISLSIGLLAVSIAATTGTLVGATAGYVGGVVDRLLMALVDLLLAFPNLLLLITVTGLFRLRGVANLVLIVCVLGFTGWMGVARIVRSQVLMLREQEFVQAARALGLGHRRIVFGQILPNALAPVIVYCTLAIGTTMLNEAALSFLGLGVPPPTPTWGVMVNDARAQLQGYPWLAAFPGLAIVGAVMCFNLLGDGLRDALDPRLR
jgi:peptide/nickel transport system permease protein